tara:strand:+ start:1674 stop:2351 length:678 start_codon:yes stop_codon:yes gene_type:complete
MSDVLAGNFLPLERCPQCSIANPNLQLEVIIYDKKTLEQSVSCWICYQCSTCHNLVSAKANFTKQQLDHTPYMAIALAKGVPVDRIMPELKGVEDDIPARARSYLSQAIASLHAPDGSVMLSGSAIDAMFKEKGYKKGTVNERIKQAVTDGVLTEGMSEWAHAVRIESNNPRHADLESPHSSVAQAETMIAFAKALGEFLFVLPAKVERGKAASKKAAKVDNGDS